MGNQDHGGVNNGAKGAGADKKQNGFIGKVRKGAKRVWVWLTTSTAGKVTLGAGAVAAISGAAKVGYDSGFVKGAASVVPTTVYISPAVEENTEEPQEPDETEPVEETTAE